jgi:hypothetical protein
MTEHTQNQEPVVETAATPNAEPIDGPQLLDEVAFFIRHFLVCEDHQLTVLAVWTLYTWCKDYFMIAPYLNVRSPEPESGKSLCLTLLLMLCNSPFHVTGALAASLVPNLLAGRSSTELDNAGCLDREPFTLLFDECHHTFGPSERQPLVALLNSGWHGTGQYGSGPDRHYIFGPKAFAGNAPLPRSLASRCIPIVLYRRRPADKVERFIPDDKLSDIADNIRNRMQSWAKANDHDLSRGSREAPNDVPPTLTPRQQDCAEPLIRIADRIGGHWPERIRLALAAVFNASEVSPALQILSDVRAIFLLHNNPECLSSRELLPALGSLEDRPWSGWSAKSGRRLGALLQPFGISSRKLNRDGEPVARGYFFKQFQYAWERYLPPLAAVPDIGNSSAGRNGDVSGTEQNPASVPHFSAIGAD